MKLFEYAIIFVPKKDTPKNSKILVQPQIMLAESQNTVNMLAARQVPEEYLNKLDEVQVVVRPF